MHGDQFKLNYSYLLLLQILIASLILVSSMSLFDIKLVESNDSRLVATSNYNYAISSPKLSAKNWMAVSVNGDNISIITTAGEKLSRTKQELGEPDRLFLESIRDEISNNNNGFTHMSWSNGGSGGTFSGSTMMSSGNVGGFGSASFSSSSGSGFNSLQMNDMNVNMRDDNNFSISKSSLPFNWSRVFFNGELVTIVYRDGEVKMQPMNAFDASQSDIIKNLKIEMKNYQATQMQQVSSTMQNSMDMVNNIFGNIMGSFPKPPSFQSSGSSSMFGNNFPFGNNNSPFNSWPFSGGGAGGGGGGGGGGAFAFAGRRR